MGNEISLYDSASSKKKSKHKNKGKDKGKNKGKDKGKKKNKHGDTPHYATPSMWPNPTDSREVLEEKRSMNLQAATGEIGMDLVFPDRPESNSTAADYQSNAAVAGEYLLKK